MIDEPRRHPRFLLLLGLAALGTSPLPFAGRDTVLVLGIPLWLWWSFAFTVSLSFLTVWGILLFWRDDDEPGGSGSATGRDDQAEALATDARRSLE